MLTDAANSRWEADALDVLPDGRSILLRLAAPEPALEAISNEVLARWEGAVLSEGEANGEWTAIREFHWAHDGGVLVKVPLTPDRVAALHEALAAMNDARLHVSAGGNVAYVSMPGASGLHARLSALRLEGMTLRGDAPLWIGARGSAEIVRSVKEALDPQRRFPHLDD
jgi:hypothetical protein